jgi:hypothetical protein
LDINFSKSVTILSDNTDLLEKVRLEKKVTTQKSEQKSFSQNKVFSGYKLQNTVRQVDEYWKTVEHIKGDWKAF